MQATTATAAGGHPVEKLQVKIGGMQCSFCVGSINSAFRRIDGVSEVSVSLAHEEALVQYDPAIARPEQFKDTLAAMGYTWRDPGKVRSFEEEEAELREARDRFLLGAVATVVALGLMATMWLGFRQPWFRWMMLALALGTMFWPAWHIKKMAWGSLRRRILNQHVLLEFAAFAGLAGGAIGFFTPEFPIPEFFAVSVFVTAYHLLSGWVSLLVRTRSSQAIKKLMSLQPATARVIHNGREEEVPVDRVNTGDWVRVRPGESIPVDGVVEEGVSGVDRSLVTGEPIPVDRGKGDEVIGGSINQTGALVVRVTHVGAESFLQKVAQHIQEARALKPGTIILVDRVLKYFVPGVVIASAIAFAVWTLGAWLVTGEPNFSRAAFAALAALVMGYPCALGMATPLAMIRGGGIAASKGILMRSGEALQIFKDVRRVVLDKTGTITRGKPAVTRVVPLNGRSDVDLLSVATSAEDASEHPLGRAIVQHAIDRGIDLVSADDFRAHVGKGVDATVNGARVIVGTSRFLEENGVDASLLRDSQAELEGQGQTVVLVAVDGTLHGPIAIGDSIKADARETIGQLRAMGIEPVMITGDNWRTASAVAKEVGIDEVLAEVLPQEKAEEVRKFQRQGYRVAMVGDGINDAPALMQADVGIAIGRSSYMKTLQNVSLAFAFNGIGVPAAVTGFVHPVWAMIAMAASVITVLANSFAGRVISLPWAGRRSAGFIAGQSRR